MPELPEVETVARDLRPRIVGATISGVRVAWLRTLRSRDAEGFAAGVIGRRIEDVGRRAKLVVVELSGGYALTIHLKMTGQLFVVPASAPVDPYVRLVFELADGREIRFRDIRKFGKIGLHVRHAATGELVELTDDRATFAGLGPEPLDPAFTPDVLRHLAAGRRAPVKAFLLDQRRVAGVGNIYADEALFRARIHPLRPAGRLKRAEIERLHAAIVETLEAGIANSGSSIDDYLDSNGERGSMQDEFLIHLREGQPCVRCGRPVVKLRAAGRGTYVCRRCQPVPRPRRAASTA
jgi:formamidopyrimidine-DNA glycosylase